MFKKRKYFEFPECPKFETLGTIERNYFSKFDRKIKVGIMNKKEQARLNDVYEFREGLRKQVYEDAQIQ